MRKEFGTSFLVVLVSLLIVSIILIEFSERSQNSSKISSSMKQGEITLEKTLNGLSQKLNDLCVSSNSVVSVEKSHSLLLNRELMAICKTSTKPYLFNIEDMFQSEDECRNLKTSNLQKTPLGNYITPSSLISSFVCEEKIFVTRKNLSFFEPYINERNRKIYTGGYAEFTSINSDKDLLVVSGGDIFIQEIITTLSPSLTFISATGRVIIKKVTGNPKLFAFGSQGAQVPYPLSENGLLPPLKKYSLSGISR